MHSLNAIRAARGSVGSPAPRTRQVRNIVPALHLVAPRGGHPQAAPFGVGGVVVQPRYFSQAAVGGVAVQPRYVAGPNGEMWEEAYGQVGDPEYGYVGAPARQFRGQGSMNKPVEYKPEEYYAGDVTNFGIGATNIPASSTGTQIGPFRPTRPFKPQNFKCPSNIQNLLILAVSIAGTNIYASELGVPIELLSEVSTFNQIEWPTLDPAIGVSFSVANLLGTAQFFKGAFYGTQVRN